MKIKASPCPHPHFFGLKIMGLLVFSSTAEKVCMGTNSMGLVGRSGMNADAAYAAFGHFCHNTIVGNVSDPWHPAQEWDWGRCESIKPKP